MLFARKMLVPAKKRHSIISSLDRPQVGRRIAASLGVLLAVGIGAAACGSNSSDSTTTTLSAVEQSNTLVEQGLHAASIGQVQQAVADFKAAISRNPVNAVPYYDLGVIYQQRLNQPALAAEYYNKALLANPTDTAALYNLAILDTSTDPQEAINLYYRILKVDPNDADTLFNVGLLLVKTKATAATGRADLRKAIKLDPSLASRVPKNVKL